MERGHVGDGRGPGHRDRLLGPSARLPGASLQTHALNPAASSTPLDVPGRRGPSTQPLQPLPPFICHQPQPGRPVLLANLGLQCMFHPAAAQGPLLAALPGAQLVPRASRGRCHLHPIIRAPAPWNMHAPLAQREAPSIATLPTLARPCGLATCPYFGPGHEQEALEGEEEQAEPQGRERDQHRPKLPLEALGQGQDEQELWSDRRTGGRTDGGTTGRERTHGRTDGRTEREGWRREGRGWKARGPLEPSPAPHWPPLQGVGRGELPWAGVLPLSSAPCP